MIRYDNKIYHRNPINEHAKDPDSTTTIRPPKLSDIKKELKWKISGCRMQLRYTGPGVPEHQREKTRKDLAKYERQLANLPAEKTHKIKRTYKKMPQEKIREYSLEQIEKAKAKEEFYITADDIAHQLNVKPHFVKQVFQQLNIEGILSQPIHSAPHDSNRDPFGYGHEKGWKADLYKIIYPDEDEED